VNGPIDIDASAPPSPTGTAHPTFTGGDGVRVVEQAWLSDRLVELRLDSDALVHPVGTRILLPAGYDPDATERHPVLYLLHGGLGGFRDWTDSGGVEALTDGLDLIVVMPYGGLGGWYRDWHNFGRGGAPMWETFHVAQLVPWVDEQLATRAERSGRAIAGLSMGGYGALSYAGRHPDTFCAAASFSGAVNTSFPLVQALICVSPRAQHRMPFAISRAPIVGRADWHGHNPWHLAEALRGMRVAITTGDGRPTRLRRSGDPRPKDLQEHQVRAMTWSLHRRFDELGIEHTFRDYGNVGHTWENWQRAFADELPEIMRVVGEVPHPT
jgi:S-formylglutathione hydrolase FrmB